MIYNTIYDYRVRVNIKDRELSMHLNGFIRTPFQVPNSRAFNDFEALNSRTCKDFFCKTWT